MSVAAVSSPLSEYQRRLAERTADAETLRQADARLSQFRGVAFLGIIVFVAASSTANWTPGWAALIPAGVFLALVVWHQRVIRRWERAKQATQHYDRAIARIGDRWKDAGPTGERYLDPDHLYAGDLDLFGAGSLFQLVCRARTRVGEDRLASWLLEPAEEETVRIRQAAVRELAGDVDLREELALLGGEVHEDLDQNQLREWAQQPPQPVSGAARGTAVVLAGTLIGVLIGWFLGLHIAWLLLVATLMGAFLFHYRRQIHGCATAADEAASGLQILARVLDLIERRRFANPALQSMRSRLDTDGLPPSQQIAKAHRLIHTLNNSLRNQFFALFAFVLALPVHLVHAVEGWRRAVGSHIPDWLDVVGEFEALVSFAGFAYESPESVFPEFTADAPRFDAEQLGHPLLPRDACVRNDLRLDAECRLMLISGSNMSGKSTLMRTVGVNAVLAQAGAPVFATRMTLSALQVASVMRIHDSLLEGRSFFYAALERMKSIVDVSQSQRPLLFLLDEILQGTNSHDRRIGAEGIIRLLVERDNIGLVTTHDLALTEIVSSFDGQAVNCHFQDELIDGRMTFDYLLRPGVVEKSNALELMRLMGLDV